MIEYSFKLVDGSRIDTKSETGLLMTTTMWGFKSFEIEQEGKTIFINIDKIASVTVKEV